MKAVRDSSNKKSGNNNGNCSTTQTLDSLIVVQDVLRSNSKSHFEYMISMGMGVKIDFDIGGHSKEL